MAIMKIALDCPNCGGTLEITKNDELFACAYCGSSIIVKRSGGKIYLELKSRIAKIEGQIENIREYTDLTDEVSRLQLSIEKDSRKLDESEEYLEKYTEATTLRIPVLGIIAGIGVLLFLGFILNIAEVLFRHGDSSSVSNFLFWPIVLGLTLVLPVYKISQYINKKKELKEFIASTEDGLIRNKDMLKKLEKRLQDLTAAN